VPERILTKRQLNRALLARQLLLERSTLAIPAALEAVGGLQTQYAPSGYIGLWSRLAGFRRDQLTEALADRTVVQATVMRATIHTVAAGDYWPFARATRATRAEWYMRAARSLLEGVDLEDAARRLRALLAAGPRRQDDLVRALESEGVPRGTWNGLAQLVDLVRVPPSGTWAQRRANLYALADDWLEPPAMDRGEAIVHLVRSYLRGFGPATRADVASWCGLTASALQPAFASLELRRFRDEEGQELLDLPDMPLPDAGAPAPPRFIGTWDANLLVHARRTGFLPEDWRPRLFSSRTPHSFPTFLVDGAVAGTWRYDDGRVQLEPFEPLAGPVRDGIEEEAARLAAWHAEDSTGDG
jgi:hypothetical protein